MAARQFPRSSGHDAGCPACASGANADFFVLCVTAGVRASNQTRWNVWLESVVGRDPRE